MKRLYALRRIGEPDDIAGAAVTVVGVAWLVIMKPWAGSALDVARAAAAARRGGPRRCVGVG